MNNESPAPVTKKPVLTRQRLASFLKTPLGNATAFVLGALVTVTISGIGERVGAAARPSAAIMTVEIGQPPRSSEPIPSATVAKERAVYFLPSLDPKMDAEALEQYLQLAKQRSGDIESAIKFLKGVDSRQPWKTEDVERVRLDILQEWSTTRTQVAPLEDIAVHVIQWDIDKYRDKYREHPPDWKTRKISLGPDKKFDLGEIGKMDIGDEERIEARNVFRRILIRMDQIDVSTLAKDMVRFFEGVKAESQKVVRDVEDALLTSRGRRHIKVDVIITNDGDRALCIDRTAVMEFSGTLLGASGRHTSEMEIYVDDTVLQLPTKIGGGETLICSLVSVDPIGKATFYRTDGSQVAPDADSLGAFLKNAVGQIRVAFCTIGFADGGDVSTLTTPFVPMAQTTTAQRAERLRRMLR